MGNIGQLIRKKRLERRWTQIQLAKRAGISQPTIRKIESGETKYSKYLARVAAALGMHLKDVDPALEPASTAPLPSLSEKCSVAWLDNGKLVFDLDLLASRLRR